MKKLWAWKELLFNDFKNLLFPITCAGCGHRLMNEGQVLCITCDVNLPRTNYHKIPNNPLEKRLWGRCNVAHAAAFYFTEKNSRVRKLIYEIKYKNNKALSKHLGLQYGLELEAYDYSKYELIIPVPLHKSKERSRGFNQCHPFAEGLSEMLHIPFALDILTRNIANPSQTHLNKTQRWENVDGIFECAFPERVLGRKIILVDDVVTTGSTLEACVQALSKYNPAEISILTMAIAES